MRLVNSNQRCLVVFLMSNLLLVSSVFATGDAKLKRLFTTSNERSIMDDARKKDSFNSEEEIEKKVADAKKEVSESSRKIVINGFIKRSEGENVVWINDQSTLNSSLSAQGIHVNTSLLDKNTVRFSVTGHDMAMKPGQTLHSNDGNIIEMYEVPKQSKKIAADNNLFDDAMDSKKIIDDALKLYGRNNSHE